MFLRYILFAFLIYLLYRLIFHFIIPIYKTTKQVKKQFSDMSARMNRSDGHGRMEEQMNQPSFSNTEYDKQATDSIKPKSKTGGGDYIDFEEVK
jgi:hypothetical protein